MEEFHESIKLGTYTENKTLRDKRDLLTKELKEKLPDDTPKFEKLDQGSYAMNTGINPEGGDYDIDVGIVFECTKKDFKNPVDLKKIVRDALKISSRTPEIRRPCITVTYIKDGETDYHVDMAIYVKRSDEKGYDLAKGKENSGEEFCVWEQADPKGLVQWVADVCDDAKEGEQYRRCVRYLKAWKEHKFSSGEPISVGLTVAAGKHFKANIDKYEGPDDLQALRHIVNKMYSNFETVTHDEFGEGERLVVKLPVTPKTDLFDKMSNNHMETFEKRLKKLLDAIDNATAEEVPEKACEYLQKQFGEEFKIPEKSETAKKTRSSIASSGMSA